MTGIGGPKQFLRGLFVARFPIENDVGRITQEPGQRGGPLPAFILLDPTQGKLLPETMGIFDGSFDGVYEALTRLTAKLRWGLAAHLGQVCRSREMSRIITDLPVTLDVQATRFRDYDRAGVLELFRDLEFRSLIPRLPPADGTANNTNPSAAVSGPIISGVLGP